MPNISKTVSTSETLFEDDYLVRTLGAIAHEPDIALTELVANAWDAGASRVDITIPSKKNMPMLILDDGHGMSMDQFKNRWMILGYNREKHQGIQVEFPKDRRGWRRRAYGNNGIGRHGLLCFADTYEVESWRDGTGVKFLIGTNSRESPLQIIKETEFVREGHGTQLKVNVERHLVDSDKIRAILSARFLHDPQFQVYVNHQSIPLPDHAGLIEKEELHVGNRHEVTAFVVDSAKTATSTMYQGIAFWVNNRLVGEPAWLVGNTAVVDGRSRFAKRYSIVIKMDASWIHEVEEDWSRFKSTVLINELFDAVCSYASTVFKKLSLKFVEESSEDAIVKYREQYEELSTLSRIEVASFAETLVTDHPTINPESLAIAVQTVIKLEKTRSGSELLSKLAQLNDSDIEGLNFLLGQWNVRDALVVLNEIDHRLAIIAAIDKLSGDSDADELHTLHPLVTQARWLFGPDLDSYEYASNISLRNAARIIFKAKAESSDFLNSSQRPDLVFRADSTVSVVGTEVYSNSDDKLVTIENILLLELKKGGLAIGREEMNQADGYVQDFINCGLIDGTPMYRAFVVGHTIKEKTSREKEIREEGNLRGRIVATTYGQLTRTAHHRLFKLKEKIPTRYENLSGTDLMERVMKKSIQSTLKI